MQGLALVFGFALDRPFDVIEFADPIERFLGDGGVAPMFSDFFQMDSASSRPKT